MDNSISRINDERKRIDEERKQNDDDFKDIEDRINHVSFMMNEIHQEVKDVNKIIEDCEKDIKNASNALVSINNILLNPSNVNDKLFKWTSQKRKNEIFRELTYNYRRYQRMINQANKEKNKAYELQHKYMKLYRGIFPEPLLECKVCFEYKKEMLSGTVCGHLICETCYSHIIKNNTSRNPAKCPSCMTIYPAKPVRIYL